MHGQKNISTVDRAPRKLPGSGGCWDRSGTSSSWDHWGTGRSTAAVLLPWCSTARMAAPTKRRLLRRGAAPIGCRWPRTPRPPAAQRPSPPTASTSGRRCWLSESTSSLRPEVEELRTYVRAVELIREGDRGKEKKGTAVFILATYGVNETRLAQGSSSWASLQP